MKKTDKETVEVFLDGETLDYLRRLSKMAGQDIHCTTSVLLAMFAMKANNEAKQANRKSKRAVRKVR